MSSRFICSINVSNDRKFIKIICIINVLWTNYSWNVHKSYCALKISFETEVYKDKMTKKKFIIRDIYTANTSEVLLIYGVNFFESYLFVHIFNNTNSLSMVQLTFGERKKKKIDGNLKYSTGFKYADEMDYFSP